GNASRVFLAGQFDHPQRDVEADDMGPASSEREGDVPRTGRQVERASAGRWRGQIDDTPLPAPVLAVRQHDGNEVVALGDRREERAHVAALAVGRGDPVAY